MKRNTYGKDLNFLLTESVLTNFMLLMPVAYLLFSDLGLNQFEIGLIQAIFAATMLLFDIPTGYFADKVSHRVSNALGDVLLAMGALVYFCWATGFWDAVLAEILFGLGLSLTNGADVALIKSHCKKRNIPYKPLFARLQSLEFVAALVGAVVGSVIGGYNIRWPFLVQGIIFFVAAGIAFNVKDTGIRRITDKHPVHDLLDITKYCIRGNSVLAWRMTLSACLMGSTMMMVWFLTPSFLAADIDIKYHGLLFGLVSLGSFVGSELVARGYKIKLTTTFILAAISYVLAGLYLSLLSMFLFGVIGMLRGVNSARTTPFMQEIIPHDIQATAMSVYGMMVRVVGTSLVLFVNFIGNFKLSYGLLVSGLVCIMMWLLFTSNKAKFA